MGNRQLEIKRSETRQLDNYDNLTTLFFIPYGEAKSLFSQSVFVIKLG